MFYTFVDSFQWWVALVYTSLGLLAGLVGNRYQTQPDCMFQIGLYISVLVQGYIQSYCVHYNLAHAGTHAMALMGEEVALMWRIYGQGQFS